MTLLSITTALALAGMSGVPTAHPAPRSDASAPGFDGDPVIIDWFSRLDRCAATADARPECEVPEAALQWTGVFGMPIAWHPERQELATLRTEGVADCLEAVIVERVDRRGQVRARKILFEGRCTGYDEATREQAALRLLHWVGSLRRRGFEAFLTSRPVAQAQKTGDTCADEVVSRTHEAARLPGGGTLLVGAVYDACDGPGEGWLTIRPAHH